MRYRTGARWAMAQQRDHASCTLAQPKRAIQDWIYRAAKAFISVADTLEISAEFPHLPLPGQGTVCVCPKVRRTGSPTRRRDVARRRPPLALRTAKGVVVAAPRWRRSRHKKRGNRYVIECVSMNLVGAGGGVLSQSARRRPRPGKQQ